MPLPDSERARTALRLSATVGLLLAVAACGRPARTAIRPAPAPGEGDAVWHYEGEEGPEHWGDLSPAFTACRDGRSQSPIDIAAVVTTDQVPALSLRFPSATLRIAHHEHVADGINNGHTIQVSYDEGDTLTVGDLAYDLVQYHFHSPGEHTVSGRRYPMEMHMVHRAANGALAVVAVQIEEGRHNDAFDPVWANLPRTKGVETHYEHVAVDVDALLPTVHTSFRYDGSLTTPPCTEGVRWFVLTNPIALDAAQLGAFAALIHGNSRPVQPLNGRPVVSDVVH